MLRRECEHPMTTDFGLLALRATVGALMAGHGAQKLFGAFGGYGLEGTAGWLESIGLKPGRTWALLAGGGEFGSGVLTALGIGGPIGPITMYGPMVTAWVTAHAGKPIWATSGGAELPLINLAAATGLALTGPGRYSIDGLFGIKVPIALSVVTAAGVAAGIAASIVLREPPPEPEESLAAGELQAGEDAAGHGIDQSAQEREAGV
jgi:putative oxidoreductase